MLTVVAMNSNTVETVSATISAALIDIKKRVKPLCYQSSASPQEDAFARQEFLRQSWNTYVNAV